MRNLFLALIAFLTLASASAQSTAPSTVNTAPAARQAYTPPPAPSDPKELLMQAANFNGLSGDGIKPWHLKATFQVLDDKGEMQDSGVYEYFWSSEKKFKRTFESKNYSVSDYGTDKEKLRVSKTYFVTDDGPEKGKKRLVYVDSPPIYVSTLDTSWVNPIRNLESISTTSFSQTERDFGNVKLNCVTATRPSDSSPPPLLLGQNFCFTPGKTILRLLITSSGQYQVTLNRLLSFQGRAVAGDISIAIGNKFIVKAHVDVLEPLGAVNEADFVPPPDALPIPKNVFIYGDSMAASRTHLVMPDYPEDAKMKGIQGTVTARVLITDTGKVERVDISSGPKELQQPVRLAIRQWVYKPLTIDNFPSRTSVEINVVFLLDPNSF